MTCQGWLVVLLIPVVLERKQEVVMHKSPPRLGRGERPVVFSNLPHGHWLGGRGEGGWEGEV